MYGSTLYIECLISKICATMIAKTRKQSFPRQLTEVTVYMLTTRLIPFPNIKLLHWCQERISSMGRRKIEIVAITRKSGLFKKARELGVLCSVDILVIVFEQNDELHQYSSGKTADIVQRFINSSDQPEKPSDPNTSSASKTSQSDGDGDGEEEQDENEPSSPHGVKRRRLAGKAPQELDINIHEFRTEFQPAQPSASSTYPLAGKAPQELDINIHEFRTEFQPAQPSASSTYPLAGKTPQELDISIHEFRTEFQPAQPSASSTYPLAEKTPQELDINIHEFRTEFQPAQPSASSTYPLAGKTPQELDISIHEFRTEFQPAQPSASSTYPMSNTGEYGGDTTDISPPQPGAMMPNSYLSHVPMFVTLPNILPDEHSNPRGLPGLSSFPKEEAAYLRNRYAYGDSWPEPHREGYSPQSHAHYNPPLKTTTVTGSSIELLHDDENSSDRHPGPNLSFRWPHDTLAQGDLHRPPNLPQALACDQRIPG
ncbi:hypothetical protein FIBSPDRAFT_882354 [Athelia psychrophila]|uniref:MADS-box domain-containing protein n=1 Tax=Athelia psychrophila TaxID=1759441 RepID=A0A166V9A2_9AGAM|nr:hypothetical protein FIBSPDRAFT_882354 [Fibularhizoctonia sp. CBS 109695]